MLLQILVFIGIALLIGVSSSAGVGGGTTTNIILISCMGYSAKQSIIVTYVFMMGGSLAATIAGAKKQTPQGRRQIDSDLVMITLPMTISGAILGTVINHFISELIITIIFTLLILNVMRTCYNQLQESKNLQPSSPLKKKLIRLRNMASMLQDICNQESKERLLEMLQQEKQNFPLQKIYIVGQIYVYTIFLILCRGSSHFDSIIGLQNCGVGTWLCLALHILLSYYYSKKIAMAKMARDQQKQSLGFIFQSQNQKMSWLKMKKGMFNGFLAGIFGASVAIGGGFILIPLWLREGVCKHVVSSSTAPLILFSASVSFFISALLGHYHSVWEVALYFSVGFIGSYTIKNLIHHFVHKYQSQNLVYLLLLFVLIISLAPFLPIQYYKYKQNPTAFLRYDPLC